jgi:presenilin-like A22 family membrane protease
MKHTVKITLILLAMFFVAQMIGLYVSNAYKPEISTSVDPQTGETVETKVHNLPYGFEPPADISPGNAVTSIIIAFCIAVVLMLLLMKFKAENFLRLWFIIVVILGIAIALNAFLKDYSGKAWIISLIISTPLGILKIFNRNMLVHNGTELLIYPGIASVLIPILSIWSVVMLLIIISLYDMYAVWHSGFMQKMAKYQIKQLKLFSGFFVPYMGKEDRIKLQQAKTQELKEKKLKKVKVHLAILGGGDVVFPILLAGVVLRVLGVWQAVLISIGATLALAYLFYRSEKGKFYPAMPFISIGCLIALGIIYLLNLL